MRIGIIGEPGRWSSERLADAAAAETGYRLLIDLAKVEADLQTGSVRHEDVDLCTLDALLIKKLGRPYSPHHLDRLDILRYVQACGIQVLSSPQAIAGVLNRLTCTVTLRAHRVPMPPTFVTEDPAAATRAVERYGRAVLKPLFSTKARGMRVVEAGPNAADEVAAFVAEGNKVVYIQKMVDLPGRDLGVVFLGGEYVATYARTNDSDGWATSTSAGGRYEAAHPDDELIELARRAQDPFGLDFTAVDVAELEDGPVVFEVSAFGGFHGLLDAHGIDMAQRWVQHALARIGHGKATRR